MRFVSLVFVLVAVVTGQQTCTNPLFSGPLEILGNRTLDRNATASPISGDFPGCPSYARSQSSCCDPQQFSDDLAIFFNPLGSIWSQSVKNFTAFNLQQWLSNLEHQHPAVIPGSQIEEHIVQLVQIAQQLYWPQMHCTASISGYLSGMLCSACATDQQSFDWFLWGNDTLLLSTDTCSSIWSSCSGYIDTLNASLLKFLQLELQIAQALGLEKLVAELLNLMKLLSSESFCQLGSFPCSPIDLKGQLFLGC